MLAIIIFALLFCRKKKAPQHVAAIDREDSPISLEERFTAFSPPPAHYSSHLPSSSQFVQPFPYANLSRSSLPTVHTNDRSVSSLRPSFSSTLTHATTSALIPRSGAHHSSTAPTTETSAPSNTVQAHATGSFIHATQFSGNFSAVGSKELTEEQAIFINNLRSSNVPPAEIARVMDVMRRERDEGLEAGLSQISLAFCEDVPPRYDFKSSV